MKRWTCLLRPGHDGPCKADDRLAALEAKAAKPHERLEALEKEIREIRAQMGILMFGKRHDGAVGEDKEGDSEAGKQA